MAEFELENCCYLPINSTRPVTQATLHKLDLLDSGDDHRRVLAVLAYLQRSPRVATTTPGSRHLASDEI